MTNLDGDNINFAEYLHVNAMPVWVYYIFLRCENLLTASWFWLECSFFGTVFSFLQCLYGGPRAVQHKIYESIRHI